MDCGKRIPYWAIAGEARIKKFKKIAVPLMKNVPFEVFLQQMRFQLHLIAIASYVSNFEWSKEGEIL